MRKKFVLTKEQHEAIIKASQPVVAIWVGGPPRSPQEYANAAWSILGDELGFKYMTVQPVVGNKMEFTAEVRDDKS